MDPTFAKAVIQLLESIAISLKNIALLTQVRVDGAIQEVSFDSLPPEAQKTLAAQVANITGPGQVEVNLEELEQQAQEAAILGSDTGATPDVLSGIDGQTIGDA